MTSSAVGATQAAPDPVAFRDDTGPADRAASRRRQILGIQAFIAGSYAMDTAFMTMLVLCGAIGFHVPMVYALCFVTGCAAFTLALTGNRGNRFADPYLTVPQTVFASALQFGMMAWAPQIGVPLLTALFIIVGFAGLRLRLPQAAMVTLWLGTGLLAVIGLRGAELSLPLGSAAERLASGLWLCTILGRVLLLGQYGARLRQALHRRNEALNRLDHFKRINDGFGHLVGDRVLVQLVRRIRPTLRSSDALGRYGGEEFLLLLADAADQVSARTALERIVEAVRSHPWAELAPGLTVTLSAGFASCRPGDSLHQLLSRADTALYRAKNGGRDRVCEE